MNCAQKIPNLKILFKNLNKESQSLKLYFNNKHNKFKYNQLKKNNNHKNNNKNNNNKDNNNFKKK